MGSIIREIIEEGWRREIDELANHEVRDLYQRTTYVCSSCTADERHNLWWTWHEHYRMGWRDISIGSMLTIGTIDDRPITVTTFWADIGNAANGATVAFVDATSQLADHRMREQWEEIAFPNMLDHANASNFHNLVQAIEWRGHVKIFNPERTRALLNALEVDPPMADPLRVVADLDPHAGFTWCEQKMLEWGERAKYYQELMRQDGQHGQDREATKG